MKNNIEKYLKGPTKEEIEKRLENAFLTTDEILLISAKNGYLEGVKRSLKESIYISSTEYSLFLACKYGHFEVVKYMIEEEVGFNFIDVHEAEKHEHSDVANYLKSKMKEENE